VTDLVAGQDEAAPARLTLVTPEDWYRLPLLEEERLRRGVAELVDRQFRGKDDRPTLRRELVDAVLEQAHRAREGGGVDMYLSHLPIDGVPLALSLVVSLVPFAADAIDLERLAPGLDDEGVQATVVDLPAGRALRRERVEARDASDLAVSQLDTLLVDYVLPGPGETALMLTFSSPLVVVADALAELFEAVAATVRWSE
jgi:hypothetical protein